MSTKETVYNYLTGAGDTYSSGQKIASELSISRTAVWKAIRSLRVDGYSIEAHTNRGYRLSSEADVLSKAVIENLLVDTTINYSISVAHILASTNDEAKRLASIGMPQGTTVISSAQSAGRGRLGRSFYSPDNTGLYMSVILRPSLSAEKSLYITTAAAVSVCAAIEECCSVSCSIKWVNDIFCRNKKVCGILTEASLSLETGGLDYAVLGIGINVYPPENGFPHEIQDTAGYLCDSVRDNLRNEIAASIINKFDLYYRNLAEKPHLNDYIRRSNLIDKSVILINGDAQESATVKSINNDFSLTVEMPDGETRIIRSGDVRMKIQ